MSTKFEKNHAAEFLLSEGNGDISREAITVVAGGDLPSGKVLGIKAATNEYAPYNDTATDGTQVAAAILYGPLLESSSPRHATGIVRLATVAASRLSGLDSAAIADLKTRHLIVR